MTLRTRIFLVYLLLVGGGFYFLLQRGFAQLQPRYLESMEEALVDSANLLAQALQDCMVDHRLDPAALRQRLDPAFARRFEAEVYSLHKDRIALRAYVTDPVGRVLYDSASPSAVGQDYARWLDVSRTLRGEYGARATRADPAVSESLVLYVAAPIFDRDGETIRGVLSLGKPTAAVSGLVSAARRELLWAGVAGGALLVVAGVVFSIWIATPLARLTEYARAVRDGRRAELPRLAGREVGELRQAFAEMRQALEGKTYVERYVQTLTHELKSPLSAIHAASELLAEDPPGEIRHRFVANIRLETERMQRVISQLLQLVTLEARLAQASLTSFPVDGLLEEGQVAFRAQAEMQGVQVTWVPSGLTAYGDFQLLSQALSHLLQNALDFTPRGGSIVLAAEKGGQEVHVRVSDSGVGIPEFARDQVFERFFSLPRPGTGRKSTGLGLSLVREIMALQGGRAVLSTPKAGGTVVTLSLPVV